MEDPTSDVMQAEFVTQKGAPSTPWGPTFLEIKHSNLRKMRHLCGLFCTSCSIPHHDTIEHDSLMLFNLFIYTILYDIDFIIFFSLCQVSFPFQPV